MFKKKTGKNTQGPRVPSPKTTVIKGKVKEIVPESDLEKKFGEHKALTLKIPLAKQVSGAAFKKDRDLMLEQMQKRERIKNKSRGKKLSLLIISSEEYLKSITIVLKRASLKYGKILYISLNELYENLIRNLENNEIDIKNFYFIDAITSTAQTNIERTTNCTFVTSPNALIELSLVISQKIDELEPDMIIFDSLSTLFIYENEATAVKFVHSLIGKMKAAGCDSILTTLEGDANRKAIKDLGMFVDEFLTMSEYQLQFFNTEDGGSGFIPIPEKENDLKKEMDKLFPKRIEQNTFLPGEKHLILKEMEKLKKNLVQLKKNSIANESLVQLEKKIQSTQKKPETIDPILIHKELVKLRKKAKEVINEKPGAGKKTVEKELGKFNSKILEIEKKLEEKKKTREEEAKKEIIAKEKELLKKAFKTQKESKTQIEKLETKLETAKKNYKQGRMTKEKFETEKQKIETLLKK